MKKLILIATCLFCFGLFGCKKFLDEKLYSQLDSENFPKTTGDFRALCNGLYNMMQTNEYYGFVIYEMTDLMADQMFVFGTSGARSDFEALNFSTGNAELVKWWQRAYIILSRANTIIQVAPTAPLTPTQVAPYVAEAKFVRALTYFQLVQFWGDVPLITKAYNNIDTFHAAPAVYRTGQDTIYRQIISDLLEAEANLPAVNVVSGSSTASSTNVVPSSKIQTSNGAPTSGAATALLAKVYLTRAYLPFAEATDFQNAAIKSKKVIDNPFYKLYDKYSDVFDVDITKKNGSEHIFSIQFDKVAAPSTLVAFLTPSQVVGTRGFGSVLAERGFYNSYAANDSIRRSANYYDVGVGVTGSAAGVSYNFTNNGGRPYCAKYKDFANLANASNDNCNHIVLRLADVLLMNSEALNRINPSDPNKYNGINAVRARVKLPALTNIPDVTNFETAILNERGWELAFEGKRRDDIIRLGRLIPVMKAAGKTQVQEFMKYYPIPQQERDLNPNLSQNLGY